MPAGGAKRQRGGSGDSSGPGVNADDGAGGAASTTGGGGGETAASSVPSSPPSRKQNDRARISTTAPPSSPPPPSARPPPTTPTPAPTLAEMKRAASELSYPELLERKDRIAARLAELSGKGASKTATATATAKTAGAGDAGDEESPIAGGEATTVTTERKRRVLQIPKTPKEDAHWDFVMKEMMWLAADFQSERKRQISHARRLSLSVRQYHRTKESRRLREVADAELRRRRLASRMARDVRGWWGKIERVIGFRQRMAADAERKRAMDRHLASLVRKTERYGESLRQKGEDEDGGDGGPGRAMTIEQALRAADQTGPSSSSRVRKKLLTDYSRVTLVDGDGELYGESTEDDDDDSSFAPESAGEDDEATLDAEEVLMHRDFSGADSKLRREVSMLLRESQMDMKTVLASYEDEEVASSSSAVSGSEEDADDAGEGAAEEPGGGVRVKSKRVKFNLPAETAAGGDAAPAAAAATATATVKPDTGSDADDDADASDVEDFVNEDYDDDGDDDEEFEVEGDDDEVDDETTLDAEERLGRDVSPEDEIAALQREGEMSLEELRAMYAVGDDRKPGVEGGETPDDAGPSTSGTRTRGRRATGSRMAAPVAAAAASAVDAAQLEDIFSEETSTGSGSDEFEEIEDGDVDDETTLEAEERLGRDMSYRDEIEMLQRENEMSVEELRAMYAGVAEENSDATEEEEEEGGEKEDPVEQYTQRKRRTASLAATAALNDANVDEVFSDGSPTGSDSEEFEADEAEVDDETTLEAEERLGRDMDYKDEIAMLQRENEMSVEELQAMYTGMAKQNSDATEEEEEGGEKEDPGEQFTQRKRRTASLAATAALNDANVDELVSDASSTGSDSEEFEADEAEVDDETTLEAEERLGRDMDYKDEIEMLQRENEMSVEELRAMYAGMAQESKEEEAEHPAAESSSSVIVTRRRRKIASRPSSGASTRDDGDSDDGTSEPSSTGSGSEEFEMDEGEVDDETTLEVEERLGRDMSYEDEIASLKRESEMSVDELRAMYVGTQDESGSDAETAPLTKKRKRGDGTEEDGDIESETANGKSSEAIDQKDEGYSALVALQESDKRARETNISRPFLLASWVKMRGYQQIGLNWLVSIQSRRLNGILADEMGLGKTLMTISMFAYLAAYKGIWGPHLIIVPTSCIVNWETEIKRFCPAFKVLTYYGSAKRRKELRTGWTKTNWHHIIVTSYQLAVQDAFAFKRKRWYYLVLDEAHNIKNFESQRWQTLINFNTQRRLLLTGTPLQNNLMELWSLLHFLMPHVFRSRKEFSYWFSNPMNNMIEGNAARNDEIIGRLHGIIRPFVLRRLKKDVETQMPGKYEHIVQCQLSRRQMFLYEEFMARSSTRTALQKGGNFMGMMNVLMQLRKVCNHPDLFEPRSVLTPFFVESLSLKTAGCLLNAIEEHGVIDRLSPHLIHPLWSIGCDVPSYDSSLAHDSIKADRLQQLETPSHILLDSVTDESIHEPKPSHDSKPEVYPLLEKIWNDAKHGAVTQAEFRAKINASRCRAPVFCLSDRTLKTCRVELSPLEWEEPSSMSIASTPKELLAMRRSQQERADEADDMIKNFVFCVPKAAAKRQILDTCKLDIPFILNAKRLYAETAEPMHSYFQPFEKASARLSSFFPEKKLVQFDAGKLQTLSNLLRDLKKNGHRVLIFTQMSKMLDILESFLNLNGHTYARLDGSTGVDARQKLMDRFNNDPKIFCFILSTRSGGLGINLTGADTVVFYDSDWNPAMDAQAQDRAHRIGQTRDVHIYRLVTEHTIEENILLKAKQKRQLDFLVMDEGKFHAADGGKPDKEGDADTNASSDVFTKGGLRDILGVMNEEDADREAADINNDEQDSQQGMSKEQMENAMASLEDEDDVNAMRGAQKEVAEELQEFDETVQFKGDADGGGESQESQDEEDNDAAANDERDTKARKKSSSPSRSIKQSSLAKKNDGVDASEDGSAADAEAEMEKEFAAWQSKVGIDHSNIAASLTPTERYGLHFREEIDPFHSIYHHSDFQRMQEAAAMEEEWDVDEIEEMKAEEERRAIEEGDLLVTQPQPEVLPRQRQLYLREKARLRAEKKRRKLTGENWSVRSDAITQYPFWYNADTGEALWDKPQILVELEAEEKAVKLRWNALPLKPLVKIMTYLMPHPERFLCTKVCRQWHVAATDISFVKHVWPVEMGALTMDKNKLDFNHYTSITDALMSCLPGDTIELGDGHYWVSEPGLVIDFPLRILGDENDPSHVVLELSGSITWKGRGGWIEGITVRRPGLASGKEESKEILVIDEGGKIDMAHCVYNNEGNRGDVARLRGSGTKGLWRDVVIKGAGERGCGLILEHGAELEVKMGRILNNGGDAVKCSDLSSLVLGHVKIEGHGGVAIALDGMSTIKLEDCCLVHNRGGAVLKDDGSKLELSLGNHCDDTAARALGFQSGGHRVDTEDETSTDEANGHPIEQ